MNRLAHEQSPYLLQHAQNPVDWWPWGEAAFACAQTKQRPVFLSVGYSTCHWCHVMERESFEDDEIAAFLNAHFVSIKVDREERPDIDRTFMLATQAMTGHGGWPMSVFLTPDRKPFYAGTYFPPRAQGGRPGFRELLEVIRRAWDGEADKVLASADQITTMLRQHAAAGPSAGSLDTPVLDRARQQAAAAFDAAHGGFGGAPKFPQPSRLTFLLREHARTGDEDALAMVTRTLETMADGGIHDQLGGGFHRYSVDAQWRVPHFEKMLYDQAQLAVAYVEAWQVTGEARFEVVARKTLDYVWREMAHAEGGFFSAQDADSPRPDRPDEKGEGAFFTWTATEVDRLLGGDAALFRSAFGIEPDGNALADPQEEFTGLNILYRARTEEALATAQNLEQARVEAVLSHSAERLLAARERRPKPHRDDKVLVSWNGLMVSAFAKAGFAFDEPRFLRAAQGAAEFIRVQLWRDEDGLLRRWRDGAAAIEGQLEDYAFLAQGLLDLYAAGFDHRHLQWSERLLDDALRRFWDDASGSFHEAAADDDELPLRVRDRHDGAVPAANSVMAMNLLRAAELLDRGDLRARAERTLRSFGGLLDEAPSAVPQVMVALDRFQAPARQVVIAGAPEAPDTRALLDVLRRRFLPNLTVVLVDGADGQAWWSGRRASMEDMRPMDRRAAAYLCREFTCEAPVRGATDFARRLDASPSHSGVTV